MRKLNTKNTLAGLAGILVLAVIGVAIYQNSEEKTTETTTTTIATSRTDGKVSVTTTSANSTTTTKTTPPATDSPTGEASLSSLEATLTATSSADQSISIAFYIAPGVYTIQTKNGDKWQDILANSAYSGTGGLVAGQLNAEEDTRVFRVLENKNGTYSAVSREFTVNRSEVMAAGGIKSYN